jgi:hypothetical protein
MLSKIANWNPLLDIIESELCHDLSLCTGYSKDGGGHFHVFVP